MLIIIFLVASAAIVMAVPSLEQSVSLERPISIDGGAVVIESNKSWLFNLFENSCTETGIYITGTSSSGDCVTVDESMRSFHFWGIDPLFHFDPAYAIDLFDSDNCYGLPLDTIDSTSLDACHALGKEVKAFFVYKIADAQPSMTIPIAQAGPTETAFVTLEDIDTDDAIRRRTDVSHDNGEPMNWHFALALGGCSRAIDFSGQDGRSICVRTTEPYDGWTTTPIWGIESNYKVAIFHNNDCTGRPLDFIHNQSSLGCHATPSTINSYLAYEIPVTPAIPNTIVFDLTTNEVAVNARNNDLDYSFALLDEHCSGETPFHGAAKSKVCIPLPTSYYGWTTIPMGGIKPGYKIAIFQNSDCTGRPLDFIQDNSEAGCHITKSKVNSYMSYAISDEDTDAETGVSEGASSAATTTRAQWGFTLYGSPGCTGPTFEICGHAEKGCKNLDSVARNISSWTTEMDHSISPGFTVMLWSEEGCIGAMVGNLSNQTQLKTCYVPNDATVRSYQVVHIANGESRALVRDMGFEDPPKSVEGIDDTAFFPDSNYAFELHKGNDCDGAQLMIYGNTTWHCEMLSPILGYQSWNTITDHPIKEGFTVELYSNDKCADEPLVTLTSHTNHVDSCYKHTGGSLKSYQIVKSI